MTPSLLPPISPGPATAGPNLEGSGFALSPEVVLRSFQKHWLIVVVVLAPGVRCAYPTASAPRSAIPARSACAASVLGTRPSGVKL